MLSKLTLELEATADVMFRLLKRVASNIRYILYIYF